MNWVEDDPERRKVLTDSMPLEWLLVSGSFTKGHMVLNLKP